MNNPLGIGNYQSIIPAEPLRGSCRAWSLCLAIFLLLTGCGGAPPPPPPAADSFTFALILVGDQDDRGWSQSQYEAAKAVEAALPGVKLLSIDNVNPATRPGVTIPQLTDQLIAQGAKLIITGSDDFQDGTAEAARQHPEIAFLGCSGDQAWPAGRNYQAIPNLANLMGRMEYGRAMAGFVAALTTKTGRIGFLGPLINCETRRLANATYLGARYAWTVVRKRDPEKLHFKATWIGYWFNIPGQTLDPSKVAADFFMNGYDVVISGIDTTEGLVKAGQLRAAGNEVWAVPYDFRGACREAPEAALGVPYFNWTPGFLKAVKLAKAGQWRAYFQWDGPDWKNINDTMTSMIGFARGPALSPEVAAELDRYIAGLGDGSIPLFQGPLSFQDGTIFLAEGKKAGDTEIWYQPQLLAGMKGNNR